MKIFGKIAMPSMNTVKLVIEAPAMAKEANTHAQCQYSILFPLTLAAT